MICRHYLLVNNKQDQIYFDQVQPNFVRKTFTCTRMELTRRAQTGTRDHHRVRQLSKYLKQRKTFTYSPKTCCIDVRSDFASLGMAISHSPPTVKQTGNLRSALKRQQSLILQYSVGRTCSYEHKHARYKSSLRQTY